MIGVIGGSSLQTLNALKNQSKSIIRTPFGIPSAPLISGEMNGCRVVFLARHGLQHTIPPHIINYRANIWALHHIGCAEIIAFSGMFSITKEITIGELVIPDQLIDYTRNRAATFFDSSIDNVQYTEFAEPYAEDSRQKLISNAQRLEVRHHTKATYGVTQGPRYETKAEIQRYRHDGCHLLGMTGMPEAALSQEIGIHYAVCGLVTKHINTAGYIEHLDEEKNSFVSFIENYFS